MRNFQPDTTTTELNTEELLRLELDVRIQDPELTLEGYIEWLSVDFLPKIKNLVPADNWQGFLTLCVNILISKVLPQEEVVVWVLYEGVLYMLQRLNAQRMYRGPLTLAYAETVLSGNIRIDATPRDKSDGQSAAQDFGNKLVDLLARSMASDEDLKIVINNIDQISVADLNEV